MQKLTQLLQNHKINLSDFDVFIETGYCGGDTFDELYNLGMFNGLKKAYSVELSPVLYQRGLDTFNYFKEEKFDLLLGDSSTVLKELSERHAKDRVLFWLDAHYSGGPTGKSDVWGECPLMGELQCLDTFENKPIVIIDDIGLFTGSMNADWPLLSNVMQVLEDSKHGYSVLCDHSHLSYIIAT